MRLKSHAARFEARREYNRMVNRRWSGGLSCESRGTRRILRFASRMGAKMRTFLAAESIAILVSPIAGGAIGPDHDTIIRNGLIYDASGASPNIGDVTIDGDRISYVGSHARGHGRAEIDARGKAVMPGFVKCLLTRRNHCSSTGGPSASLSRV